MDETPFAVAEDELIADVQRLLKDIDAALHFASISRDEVLEVLTNKLILVVGELRRLTESDDES